MSRDEDENEWKWRQKNNNNENIERERDAFMALWIFIWLKYNADYWQYAVCVCDLEKVVVKCGVCVCGGGSK